MRQYRQVQLRIEETNKGKMRQLSLGATPWIAANVIPPAIREFREVMPELQIRIFAEHSMQSRVEPRRESSI